MDRYWSVVCGLQPALSEDEIMTVWPRNMEDYQAVGLTRLRLFHPSDLIYRGMSTTTNTPPSGRSASGSRFLPLVQMLQRHWFQKASPFLSGPRAWLLA